MKAITIELVALDFLVRSVDFLAPVGDLVIFEATRLPLALLGGFEALRVLEVFLSSFTSSFSSFLFYDFPLFAPLPFFVSISDSLFTSFLTSPFRS